jgi:membrane-associated phospholipid phosphatase
LALRRQPVIIGRTSVIVPTRRSSSDPAAPPALAGPAADPWSLPVPRGRYFGTFAIQYLLWLAGYLGVNHVTGGRSALQPLLPGEASIPLVTWAYPFYGSVYLEIILPLFLSRTRRAYARTQIACALGSLIAFAVYLAAPMPYPRPALEVDGPLAWLLALEWSIDQPRCTFPSLHVFFAWLMYLGLRDEAPRWRPWLLALAVAVSISTVLVKQHFIVDVPGGMALAWIAWWLSPRLLAHLTTR